MINVITEGMALTRAESIVEHIVEDVYSRIDEQLINEISFSKALHIDVFSIVRDKLPDRRREFYGKNYGLVIEALVERYKKAGWNVGAAATNCHKIVFLFEEGNDEVNF